jgi:hypothetical protein
VGPLADLLVFVPGFHAKLDAAIRHREDFGGKRHHGADRRRGHVRYVDLRAHRIVARRQQRQRGIAAGPLHAPDHVRSGKHARAFIAQEIDGHVGRNQPLRFALGAGRDPVPRLHQDAARPASTPRI